MSNFQSICLNQVIDNNLFYHHYQPVYNIHNNKAFGYEGLLRSKYVQNPQLLFDKAIKIDRLAQLDTSSVTTALKQLGGHISHFHKNDFFFLNIYPSTLASDTFLNCLEHALATTVIPVDHIILEINESERIADFNLFLKAVNRVKSLGLKIALDDIGKGVSPFRRILELEPDIIKLDKYFSDELATTKYKQDILNLVTHYCKEKKIEVVLEGIETQDDLLMAKSLGIDLVQGFLLGKPNTLNNLFTHAVHH